MGGNYVGAQRFLREQSEDIVDQAVMKQVQQAAKAYGVTLITRVAKAPYMMGSAERSVAVVKNLWPKRSMHYWEVEFMCEKVMHCVNQRPLSLSNVGQSFRVKKSALWFREPNLRILMVPEYFLKEYKNLQ